MKTASVIDIKKELAHKSFEELADLCLRLTKFKKENKELLSYLLFEAHHEDHYIQSIKIYIDSEFEAINTTSYFYIKKSVRKILRNIKKYTRYSPNKETEVELHIYFCEKLNAFRPTIKNNITLLNIYNRQLQLAKKTISTLHDDLQYDFNLKLETL